MATEKEQNKVVKSTAKKTNVNKTGKKSVKKSNTSSKVQDKKVTFDRSLAPVAMVQQAFGLTDKSEKKEENLKHMPYLTGVNDDSTNYNAEYLVDKVKKFFKEVDAEKPDYQNANYADAALLAKAIVTCTPNYVFAIVHIVREMIKQTLTAVKAGLYFPLIKNGNVVKPCHDSFYIERFISRATQVLKSDEYTIVAKGPYFVFGWVDDQNA